MVFGFLTLQARYGAEGSRFPSFCLPSAVLCVFARGTSFSSRPFATLTQAAKIAKKAIGLSSKHPFLFAQLCFPWRSLRLCERQSFSLACSLHSLKPCLSEHDGRQGSAVW